MAIRVILFLILNFSALAIGGLFTGAGVKSAWYAQLEKAPWTPPGWVFGAAWTTIMVSFAFYMNVAFSIAAERKMAIYLFAIQWVLNVLWNPVFFYFHQTALGLLIITMLSGVVFYMCFYFYADMKLKAAFIFPYAIWLIIATSLNAYIVLKN